ncbi:MAG: peptidoglycan binding domain-containing protein [Buchananella hordeovulneris]|nr:peptidoglycan binding domain-containing protein [Buchananella hordeovulneris]
MNAKKKWIIGSLAGVTLLAAGAATGYAVYYGERALPNTSVAGQSVAGMDRGEIMALVERLSAQTVVTTTVGGDTKTATLAELGVMVDSRATADAALAPSSSVVERFTSLFSSHTVVPRASRDQAVLDAYSVALASSAGPAAQNAAVKLEGTSFTVVPGKTGSSVDTEQLASTIDTAINTLSAQTIDLPVSQVEPEFSTADAEANAKAAADLVSPEVTITDGIDNFSPTMEDKVKWVLLTDSAGKPATPSLDPVKVNAWVNELAESTNVKPIPAVANVDGSGRVLVEATPGKDGLNVNNAADVSKGIQDALAAGKDYSGDFDYENVKPPTENRPALPGYENYAYPAAAGEKWVDVNLTRNTLTAYEGQKVVYGPLPINHGSPGNETVTGIFHVYLKYNKQDMGCTPDWPYCAKDVPWVTYFHGSYAIHGAPWVEEFGRGSIDGSHGCVNLPVDQAQWIHSWTEMGTPVASHY